MIIVTVIIVIIIIIILVGYYYQLEYCVMITIVTQHYITINYTSGAGGDRRPRWLEPKMTILYYTSTSILYYSIVDYSIVSI